jgi:peptide/nickel transport system permease protein
MEIRDAAGKTRQVREYPRLANGGAHLKDPARDRADDVAAQCVRGAALGFIVWLMLSFALLAATVGGEGAGGLASAWTRAWSGASEVPWRALLIALLVICLLAGMAATLGSRYHLLGTDKVGQDVLYLALKSVRTALIIGTLTTLVMLPLGVLLGIAAGYFGGWIDDLIQYVYTTLNSIPGVLLIAAAVLMMQVAIDANPGWFATAAERADFRLLCLCFILGMMSWTGLCRLMRGEALKLRELEYVQAARAFGVSRLAIIVRHILPNVMHLVIISAVMDFSGMVLTEAVLSYVGVGVDPSMSSFGSMINAARLEMSRDPMVWWSLAAAFFFMLSLVLAANLFADAVRDAFDPRLSLKGRRRGLRLKVAA